MSIPFAAYDRDIKSNQHDDVAFAGSLHDHVGSHYQLIFRILVKGKWMDYCRETLGAEWNDRDLDDVAAHAHGLVPIVRRNDYADDAAVRIERW
tara:strand:- start:386 stop:667 length:282 start_codon:yes stop_codon:yes gene_type:complete